MRLLWIILYPLLFAPATSTTQPATTRASQYGPDMVVLKELRATYEAVPFNHKDHAKMAEMWGGCTTCHHRTPHVTRHVALPWHIVPTQAMTSVIPACKSCHEPSAAATEISMPNLKGAYHRQCLNCHREWMHENACNVCHLPLDPSKQAAVIASTQPTPDDIVGRMHPPIPAPDVKIYKPRFTPAVGTRIIFRHEEHTTKFGLKCVSCHHKDNCAHCHDGGGKNASVAQPIMRPGRTWHDSHEPCVGCHEKDRCKHCHYSDENSPPPAFEHRVTGQVLDNDHTTLQCAQCHAQLKTKLTPTCGDSSCHKPSQAIAFPKSRPGPTVTKRVDTIVAVASPTSQPSTKPAIVKIRSVGS